MAKVNQSNQHADDGWDHGWDEHDSRQRRRFAAWTLDEKLDWLEDITEAARELQSGKATVYRNGTSSPVLNPE